MSVFNAYMQLSGAIDADVLRDEPLSRRTTLRIGGPADLVVVAHSYPALSYAIDVLDREKVPWVVMGKGSNILCADSGYRGCVICLGREFSRIAEDGESITCGGAVITSKLVNAALKLSLSGLECCTGIPGTVGGAVAMNAGTRDQWIGSVVRDVVIARQGEGLVRLAATDVAWGYRSTSFEPRDIILEATFDLVPDEREKIARRMEALLTRRKLTQPTGLPTCGSVFKNPHGKSVGSLIDRCGLKGTAHGGARISTVHANFVVNENGASAADVCALMKAMSDGVYDAFGIDLEPEVRFLGFGA